MTQNSDANLAKIADDVYNPICFINVKLATIDSPKFRASVNYFEDQLSEFIKLLDGLTKLIELYTKEYMKCNDFNDSIIKRFLIFKDKDILDNISKNIIQIFNDNISIIYSYKINMVDDLFEKIISELYDFCQAASKDIYEKKHIYDKSLDKYESILNKYSGASKSKDQVVLTEMYNQAEEMKKKFITNGIELCECIITFKTKLNQLIHNIFNFFYNENVNYHNSILNSFNSVKPDFNSLKSKLDENISYYNKMKESFENDSSRPKYEKSGWLYKKYQKGWSRRYFSIKKGVFKYSMTSSSGKKRGFVWTSTPINILLCEVKEETNNERRFCFSVITAKKTYILQAESENELKEWLNTFEIAKHEKLKNLSNTIEDNQKAGDIVETLSDDELKIEDEDEDGEYLSRSFKGRINNIHLTPNVIIYQNEQYENRNKEFHAIFEDIKEDEYLIYNCSCAIQHGVTIQGSIFLTIDYIYFYSKIFKYVTKYKIPFRDIISIDSQAGVVYNIISIKTNESENNEYIIKMYLKDMTKVYRILNTIWENNTSKIQLNAQEIFDKIYGDDEISDDSESIDESMIENLNETENNSMNFESIEELKQESNTKKKDNEVEKKEVEVEKIEPLKVTKENKESTPTTTLSKTESPKMSKKEVDTKKTDTNKTSSSASNNNKYSLPPNIPKPSGPIVFNEVLEKKVREVILPIPAKQLNDILYGEDVSLQQKIRDKKKEFDMTVGEWAKNKDGNNERLVKYMIPVNNVLVKDKETITEESQILLKSDEYLLYVYECLARTPKMPYGEYFLPVLKYIITYQTETTCKLNISVGIRWSKSPNYIIKNAIKSPTLKGLVESAEGTLSAIIPECERLANTNENGDVIESIESSNNGGATASTPVATQIMRSKSMLHSYNNTETTPDSTEEKKSDFNLITIIVSALLALSVILNMVLLLRGKKENISQTITIEPKLQITQAFDYCTELLESDFKPWNDILTMELGNSHSKSIENFLDTHFKRPFIQDLGGDTVFNIDNVKTPTSNQPKNFTYYNKNNSLMFFKFQESYSNIRNMKKEIIRTYHDLDIHENKLIIMEYFNWFSDLLEKCIDNDQHDNKKQTANPEDIAELYDKDGNINSAQFVKLPNGKILKKEVKDCFLLL
ncbi:hypothetical protein BCR36DRAFT_588538 [Piromyces finnis]|uniref:Uncharacterized protein n=1 Tax=Piromyces finnis TaxID=1754191 RepID=A0A1Y1UBL1_9FUNG|nr:hypothetical protein BCR36DRAFT_588538 [Piromyces finnis]|eukprot:ORX34876.1 hypothetical protein BCR36DRAFT_588538 [Piromyces finnis]